MGWGDDSTTKQFGISELRWMSYEGISELAGSKRDSSLISHQSFKQPLALRNQRLLDQMSRCLIKDSFGIN